MVAVGVLLIAERPLAVPAATAAEQDPALTIDRVSINPDGTGVFGGIGAPNARVALMLGGRAIGEAIANAQGGWQLELGRALTAGEHRIRAVAHADNTTEPKIGVTVRISIPSGFGSLPAAHGPASDTTEQDLRRRASELADRASRGFDELLPKLTGTGAPGVKLAAIQKTQVTADADGSMADAFMQWLATMLANAQEWLESSARDYQSVIVRRLSDPVAEPSGAPTAEKQSRGPSAPPVASQPARQPDPDALRRAESERLRQAEIDRAAASRRAAEEEASRKVAEQQRIAAVERAKAEAESRRRAADEARRQQQEAAKAEAQSRAAEEARRQQEAARADAEAKRKAAEAQRIAGERAKLEAEVKRKAAEAQRLAVAEAAKAQAEAERRAAEATQAAAERAARAAADAARKAAEEARIALVEKPARADSSAAGARAEPLPATLGKRAASRRAARRDRRPVAEQAGGSPWCNFFHYRYPMQLLDPGQWLAPASLLRR
jgi:hypothetical protein